MSTSSMSSPHSSLTRIPVAYNNSTIRTIAKCQRVTLLCTRFRCCHRVERLVLAQHRGQRAAGLGHLEASGGVAFEQSAPQRPRGEHLHRRRTPGQRRACCARGGLRRQPGSQDRQTQTVQSALTIAVGHEPEQRPQVTEIGAAGVLGAVPLQREVLVELLEDGIHVPTVAEADRTAQVTRRSVSGVRSASVG